MTIVKRLKKLIAHASPWVSSKGRLTLKDLVAGKKSRKFSSFVIYFINVKIKTCVFTAVKRDAMF